MNGKKHSTECTSIDYPILPFDEEIEEEDEEEETTQKDNTLTSFKHKIK